MEVLRESFDTQKYLQQRVFHRKTVPTKINAFIAFLVNDCDALVKQTIETSIKICEKQKIPIKERRIRRKKKIPGEHAEDVGLSAVEKSRDARSYGPILGEAEKWFNKI